MLEGMAGHGMNSIFVSMGGHMNDPAHPDKVQERTTLGDGQRAILDRWQQATAKRGSSSSP